MRPKLNRLERQARGEPISMAALASKSLAVSDMICGMQVVRRTVNRWVKAPSFEEEVEKRRSRFGSMEY